MSNNDKFWIEDPTILFTNKNYLKVIPQPNMTRVQQLNSITLFCIYWIIVIFIFKIGCMWYYVPIIIIIFTIILYYVYINDVKTSDKNIEKFNIPNENKLKFNHDFISENKVCNQSDDKNYFFNPLITYFNLSDPVAACNSDIQDTSITTNNNYKNLFIDTENLYNLKNTERIFYTNTVPPIPNDQNMFGNWLYKTGLTCKEDQKQCLRYEDIRGLSAVTGYR